jgi:predicted O-linked N-acetylglucosamine transferase (SPINDLY family)
MSDSLLQSANSLLQLGRRPEALTCYESYLKTHPQSAEGWHNHGITLSQMQRFDEAIASFDKVLALHPDSAQTWSNRGNALFEQKRYEEAIADYDNALALDPDYGSARGYRLLAKLWCCDWRDLDSDIADVTSRLRAGARVIQPFGNLMISHDPPDQLLCARLWSRGEGAQPLWRGQRYTHEKIRVAYLSGDFCVHPVSILMAGVFEEHDRSRFETTAISFGPDDGSALRTRVMKSFDRFLDVRGRTDVEVASLMHAAQIDIAVDLMGLTGNSRQGILAHRPAPVQVNYLGFPGTMASPHIDYILADKIVIPEAEQHHYSEKVVYLPDTYMPSDAKRRVSDRSFSRAEAGLPEKGIVFCCFNNSYKLRPEMFDVWMRLLKAIDGSVLWLSQPNDTARRNLIGEAGKRSVTADRLVFAPFLANIDDHLARLTLADVFLDTLPCNAHTTASDALFMGVPVVTTPGPTFAGRVAASMLSALWMKALIMPSISSYEALALALAQRPQGALSSVKAKLGATRASGALFDTVRFTRHLEAAFATMRERQRRGLPPQSFSVDSAGSP